VIKKEREKKEREKKKRKKKDSEGMREIIRKKRRIERE
jgi:hypothetical protein